MERCRGLWGLIVCLALAMALVGCDQKAPPSTATDQLPKVRVSYSPLVIGLPLYVAHDQNLFTKHGIKVEPKQFISANEMINSVVAGQADAVVGVSMVPILNLEAQHPGFVRLVQHSRMTDQHPLDGLLVKTNSAIHTLEDLKGHKVGLIPGTTATSTLKALLKKRGIPPETVECIQLPPNAHLSALESGAVDALLAYDPTLTIALKQGGFRQVFGSIYAALLSPNPISATIISRDFERKNAQATKQFIQGLDEAITFIRSNRAVALSSLTNYTKVPADVAPYVNTLDDSLSIEVDEKNVQDFIGLMESIGEVPPGKVKASALLAPSK